VCPAIKRNKSVMSLLNFTLQILCLFGALGLIVYQGKRGWKRGFGRQFFDLLALVGAYITAVCAGDLLLPLFHPFGLPEAFVKVGMGLSLAVVVFFGVLAVGRILQLERARKRRGAIQPRPRLMDAGGAVLGGIFALAALWIALIGLRLMGTVAETEMSRQAAIPETKKPKPMPMEATSQSVMTGLATLKQSMEVGPAGEVVKRADPLPSSLYTSLRKLAQLLARPERAELFLAYPGAQELIAHPRFVALTEDAGITQALEQGNYLALLRNPEVVAAANDPGLREMLGRFPLEQALDFALEEQQPGLLPIGEQR